MERRLCIGDLCTRMSARSIGDERRATSHGGARCAAGLQRSKRVGESQEGSGIKFGITPGLHCVAVMVGCDLIPCRGMFKSVGLRTLRASGSGTIIIFRAFGYVAWRRHPPLHSPTAHQSLALIAAHSKMLRRLPWH